MVWTAVVAGAVAYAISANQAKKYEAAAKLMLDNAQPADVVLETSGTRSLDPERDVNTGLALVKTKTVANRVKNDLGLRLSLQKLLGEVSAATQGNSNVVVIKVRDRSPARAAAIANAFAREYVDFRRSSARASYDRTAQLAQSRLDSLPPSKRNGSEARVLSGLLQRLQIAATLQTGGLQRVDAATAPAAPSTPRPKLDTAVGVILGLLIGSILSVVLESTDRRLKDEEDVERLVGLPVLARVPYGKRSLVSGSSDWRFQQEAYATLAVNLRLLALGAELRTIMLTSATNSDGKTSVTLGVGKALASVGQRVIAVEADFRRPRFAEYLELPRSGGLTTVIEGLSSLSDELVEVDLLTGTPLHESPPQEGSFAVLPAGQVWPDPHRLLSSVHMLEILAEARRRADVLLIDTPALGMVSDALSLARVVDTSVYVLRLNRATKEGTRHALQELTKVGIDVAGVVLTQAPSRPSYYYAPEESYNYAPEAQPKGARKLAPSRLWRRR